jgi:signal transduction histidine kinase/CheY-like chemotaxis protein
MDQLLQFFSNDYMPHGHCYLWLPSILWVNVVADLLIAFAYFSIPILLIMVIRKRKDIKFKGIFLLFAAFILACGISHLFAIYTIWHGSYGWHGISKMVTAIVSVATAYALVVNRHALVSIPTAYQLELALGKAEAANEAKQSFLASVSHEIRTPINGVMGMINLALKNERDTEQIKKLSIAQKSAASLLVVINDIIDFSRVEAGKLSIEKVPFQLGELLNETVKAFSSSCQNKNVEVLIDVRKLDVDYVIGDPGRIKQIISNLINNAIKFTERGDIVVVASMVQPSTGNYELCCCVKDTGIGIPASKIDILFTPFTQADATTTRKYGGTGLGLSICRELARLMGGDITVESEVGVGSEFCFNIPLELPAGSSHNAPADFKKNNNDKSNESVETILLLNDNRKAIAIHAAYLSKANYKVVFCSSIEKLDSLDPEVASSIDAILVDANLLTNDNTELVKFERTNQRLRGVWLMDFDHGAQSTINGIHFTGFIDKPVFPNDMFDALTKEKHSGENQSESSFVAEKQKYPINILIVEDNEINQTVIMSLLEDSVEGFAVAFNGQEALNMLKESENAGEKKFDLIFMDCQMPIMDGYEATKRIRSGEAGDSYKNAFIAAMTANAMTGDKEMCLAAGMDDYISKPINFDRVIEVIDRLHRDKIAAQQ